LDWEEWLDPPISTVSAWDCQSSEYFQPLRVRDFSRICHCPCSGNPGLRSVASNLSEARILVHPCRVRPSFRHPPQSASSMCILARLQPYCTSGPGPVFFDPSALRAAPILIVVRGHGHEGFLRLNLFLVLPPVGACPRASQTGTSEPNPPVSRCQALMDRNAPGLRIAALEPRCGKV